MKISTRHILTWTSLICTYCVSSISASFFHSSPNSYSPYYTPSYSSYAPSYSSYAPSYSSHAHSYPSYFAPSYPNYYPSRHVYPYSSYPAARVPLAVPAATVPVAVPAATVPVAVPAAPIPAALPATPVLPAPPTYRYVTVIPQNAPPHGYSVNYFRKYFNYVPTVPAVPTIPAIPAVPAAPAIPAIPATAPTTFIPQRSLYPSVYPHFHQSGLEPHVHSPGYFGPTGTVYPQVATSYPYRAAPTVHC